MDSRIRVFTGHFGSGKTEISINYALKLSKQGKKVAIADLDIVNPYFCTRDEAKMLKENGIRVIATSKDLANAELGVIPSETVSVFNDKSYDVVLDVGGDDQGAVALGQYNRYFKEEDYDMYFVINTTRPFTNNIEGIIEYIKDIEAASRLKVKYLINNTNLSYETDINHIVKGQKIIKEVSNITNIPIRYVTVMEDLVDKLPDSIEGEILPLKLFMIPPWRRFDA
ncbi:MAG: ATP-binding protein [Caloramator sp.]|nr:ATP-binding protein [Caloramator sp.]